RHRRRQRRGRFRHGERRGAGRADSRRDRQWPGVARHPGILADVHPRRRDRPGGGHRHVDRRADPQIARGAALWGRESMTAPSRAWILSWETTLVLLIIAAGAWSTTLSSYYLSFDQIAYSSRHFVI